MGFDSCQKVQFFHSHGAYYCASCVIQHAKYWMQFFIGLWWQKYQDFHIFVILNTMSYEINASCCLQVIKCMRESDKNVQVPLYISDSSVTD